MGKVARATDEDDLDMAALIRLVEAGERKAKNGIRVSHWDAPNEFQAAQELTISDELAESLRQQGRADVREIVPNCDSNELPDCIAKLNGAPIRIEVTELIDARNHFSDWPQERFQQGLATRIREKDQKAGKPERAQRLATLDELWLVIAIDEPLLTPPVIGAYRQRIRLTKPSHFDAVFVLGPYEPTHNAVAPGREHEP